MTDLEVELGVERVEESLSSSDALAVKTELVARAKVAGLSLEDVVRPDDVAMMRLGMRSGRESRPLYLTSDQQVRELLSVPFEKYVFLSGFEAICSYQDGMIEAAIRPLGTGFMPSSMVYRGLFGFQGQPDTLDVGTLKLVLEAPRGNLPRIEISPASEVFTILVRTPSRSRLTLKLSGCGVTTHDDAILLLKKSADSLFFQIDLLSNVPLSLERERKRFPHARRQRKRVDLAADLQYPKTEFDDAPIFLYWYARSAAGMPLLQFLAFYQVIEFYFPIYSEAEAQRKLRAILKDPTFRGDRDADIGKLLSAIHVSRSGGFGDERSQLRATLGECVDAGALRVFFESDQERREFYTAKAKSGVYHKVPLANPGADLRTDVADRIYDIRCKIVHTKNDSRDEFELLLPFSKEAEQLFHDIELVQHLAHSVLVAGSSPFRSGG